MREMFDKGGLVATVWETCHHEPDVRSCQRKKGLVRRPTRTLRPVCSPVTWRDGRSPGLGSMSGAAFPLSQWRSLRSIRHIQLRGQPRLRMCPYRVPFSSPERGDHLRRRQDRKRPLFSQEFPEIQGLSSGGRRHIGITKVDARFAHEGSLVLE